MRRLLLIRHARAASSQHLPDTERPLTDEGRSEFREVALAIIQNGGLPGFIFHSPARRTTETAAILASESNLPDHVVQISPWLAIGSGCQDVLSNLAPLPANVTAVVGHEPIMSSLTTMLLGRGRVSFCPGTCACLEFDEAVTVGTGRLLWTLDP